MPSSKGLYPFPYQGSKRRQASNVMSYFPSRINRFIEPFSGSAAVSIAVSRLGIADKFWINDVNVQLMRLWKVILTSPGELCDEYKKRWIEQKKDPVAYYKFIQRRYFLHRRAADLFFLLHRSANSIVRFNQLGGFNNTPRPDALGCSPVDVRERILKINELLSRITTITGIDYRSVLACAERDDFVYMDPPYHDPHHKNGNYVSVLDHDAFCEQLVKLNNKRVPYIVSYGDKERDASNGCSFRSGLRLTHIEVDAGNPGILLSNGQDDMRESMYLSRAAVSKLGSSPNI